MFMRLHRLLRRDAMVPLPLRLFLTNAVPQGVLVIKQEQKPISTSVDAPRSSGSATSLLDPFTVKKVS